MVGDGIGLAVGGGVGRVVGEGAGLLVGIEVAGLADGLIGCPVYVGG